MSTRLTSLGDDKLVETLASFGGKPMRVVARVLLRDPDQATLRAEIIRQAEAIRVRKGVAIPQPEPVV
jgi:hypothetical protein